jgi:hypothetical protein
MAQNNHGLTTPFLIILDHCASSAEKQLPVDKYRIPAMIYSPGFMHQRNTLKRRHKKL